MTDTPTGLVTFENVDSRLFRTFTSAGKMEALLDRVLGTYQYGEGVDPDLPMEIVELLDWIKVGDEV